NISLKLDSNYLIVVIIMAGITTGIFGGILRDILCNRTAMVPHKELYASVSLIVVLFYLTFIYLSVTPDICLLVSFYLGMGLGMAAIRCSLSLPTFSYKEGSWRDENDPTPATDGR